MTIDGGGWVLGMNINTGDGHMVHYSNNDFWTSTSKVSTYTGGTSNVNSCFTKDFKALDGGNVWANYTGTKLLIVVHESNGKNYYGWRSWKLSSIVTKFSDFWAGGYVLGSNVCGVEPSGVNYYKRITDTSSANAVSGPAGSLW
jgi:hypothetical protein